MRISRLFGLAATTRLAIPTVLAIGRMTISNLCPFPIYYEWIQLGALEDKPWLTLGPTAVSETLQQTGAVVKLSKIFYDGHTPVNNIMQLEYTASGSSGHVVYDISMEDGHPFSDNGFRLKGASQNSEFPTCISVPCPPGQYPCKDTYYPGSPDASLTCPDSVDLVFVACPIEYSRS